MIKTLLILAVMQGQLWTGEISRFYSYNTPAELIPPLPTESEIYDMVFPYGDKRIMCYDDNFRTYVLSYPYHNMCKEPFIKY